MALLVLRGKLELLVKRVTKAIQVRMVPKDLLDHEDLQEQLGHKDNKVIKETLETRVPKEIEVLKVHRVILVTQEQQAQEVLLAKKVYKAFKDRKVSKDNRDSRDKQVLLDKQDK